MLKKISEIKGTKGVKLNRNGIVKFIKNVLREKEKRYENIIFDIIENNFFYD